ncbi:MAG TPA: HEPN domain-containing protein [Propionibacteriaceae bacterium]|nr:HEPN domain-containing protein [Propionibacteriaceae bacterium]
MTPFDQAQKHHSKAREFLEAAEANRDLELFNAATSAAVAINSKDAICLTLAGRTNKSENHNEAVSELRRAGRAGADLAPTLSRLLKLTTKSQYAPVSATPSDTTRAVQCAQRLMTGAEDVFAGR